MFIKKLLIANRGEIALRILQTCRERGISCVAVYTESERDYPHAHKASESYCLGEGPLSETYLNEDKILHIAKMAKVQAVHPGYGLLSEKYTFAEKVRGEGLIFIGPNAKAIRLMGSKRESKKRMAKIGIPLIPGYYGDNTDKNFLKQKAIDIGFPVLIKASLGGGGKGMRIVQSPEEFFDALDGAKREAKSAFGDESVLLEKYITNPRHIEVQVMSDRHGNHLHFYERECSIQRRYQKILEETPSFALDDTLREKMVEAAVSIAKDVDYEGAGTVEFILDDKRNFYFLEMNTRLQVEHPITEMVTGWDLVDLQILVACGEKLPMTQKDITPRGHAIELRIYAENPDKDFLPQTGTILHLGKTVGSNIRFDCGYKDFNDVSVNFDPMLAKLTVYGQTRESCIAKALCALEDVPFLGVQTNRDYLARILKHKAFKEGRTSTDFVEIHKKELGPIHLDDSEKALLITSYLYLKKKRKSSTIIQDTVQTDWDRLLNFRAF